VRYTPVFAELNMPSCTLAIGHTQTTQLFGTDSARPADNHTIIIEFRVEDVDSEYERLKPLVNDWVQEPTTMPWGNRSILFRDPDGNLVNFFTPVTEDAIKEVRVRRGQHDRARLVFPGPVIHTCCRNGSTYEPAIST
jgi:hypothetical protein